jgi:hypothetical protein
MPDGSNKEDKKPETNFIPPLDMVLTFFEKRIRSKSRVALKSQEDKEKNVEKLIEKLSDEEKEK